MKHTALKVNTKLEMTDFILIKANRRAFPYNVYKAAS
jgi:hypothetical protein